MEIEMKIESNGVQIAVRDIAYNRVGSSRDDAPTLVFLHYWGGSSRTWKDVIASLPDAYRSVAPDHRGWGDSDKPADGYALANLADDAQQVITKLNLKRFILIGHSMGGKVAQLLASRRPYGLVGLVLVAPSPPTPLALPIETLAAMERAYFSRESVEATLDGMLSAKPLSIARREQVIEDSLCGGPEAKAAWPRYASQEDISSDVLSIDVPTVVIAGEMDRVDSVATLQAQLLPRIAHASMHVLPGTGHLSPLESPREVAALIHAFVRQITK